MSIPEVVFVLTTVSDDVSAQRIATGLVDARLAACVTVLGAARSTYRWQSGVQTSVELPVLIKTTMASWPALRDELAAMHPYDVPEILMWRALDGAPEYLRWVQDMVE